jgi:hypothetical protein
MFQEPGEVKQWNVVLKEREIIQNRIEGKPRLFAYLEYRYGCVLYKYLRPDLVLAQCAESDDGLPWSVLGSDGHLVAIVKCLTTPPLLCD